MLIRRGLMTEDGLKKESVLSCFEELPSYNLQFFTSLSTRPRYHLQDAALGGGRRMALEDDNHRDAFDGKRSAGL